MFQKLITSCKEFSALARPQIAGESKSCDSYLNQTYQSDGGIGGQSLGHLVLTKSVYLSHEESHRSTMTLAKVDESREQFDWKVTLMPKMIMYGVSAMLNMMSYGVVFSCIPPYAMDSGEDNASP